MHANPKKAFLATALLLCLAVTFASAAPPPAVEWLVDGDTLEPATTIEVRFDRDMVDQDDVGTAAKPALAVEPALPGTFTWLSRRSGVYVPSQVPGMGRAYTFTLVPGLKDARNEPVKSSLHATLKTPAFDFVDLGGGPPEDGNSSPVPEQQLTFNRDVKLDGAAELFRYIADDGKAIAAVVSHARSYRYYRYFPAASDTEDWDRRWQLSRVASQSAETAAEESADDGDDENSPPVKNRLVIKPASPLTPGPLWHLEIKPGLGTKRREAALDDYALAPVSYTHLTLPTKRIV